MDAILLPEQLAIERREERQLRTLLRWTALASFAGGIPWTFPAVVIMTWAAGGAPAIPLLVWLTIASLAGSILWSHQISGPDSVRIVPSEWVLALGAVGGNILLGALVFAWTAPVSLGLATVLATLAPLSPLGLLPMIPAMPVSMAMVRADDLRAWSRRVTKVSTLTILGQLALALRAGGLLI